MVHCARLRSKHCVNGLQTCMIFKTESMWCREATTPVQRCSNMSGPRSVSAGASTPTQNTTLLKYWASVRQLLRPINIANTNSVFQVPVLTRIISKVLAACYKEFQVAHTFQT